MSSVYTCGISFFCWNMIAYVWEFSAKVSYDKTKLKIINSTCTVSAVNVFDIDVFRVTNELITLNFKGEIMKE